MTVRRRLALLGAILLGGTLFYFGSFAFDYGAPFRKHDPLIATDNARLDPARITSVNQLETVEALQAALADARTKGLKVSMAGSHHSQGGQTYTEGGVQFDMRGFRKVLAIDTAGGTITVESGATWTRSNGRWRRMGSRSR
jgi:FAD/FMN-containing dehydrogenase